MAEPHWDLEPIFEAERDERLSSMEAALLELEGVTDEGGRRRAIDTLLRDAHSLKGAAQLVGKRDIARITHAIETRLQAVRSGAPTAHEVAQLRDALGTLRAVGVRRSGSQGTAGSTSRSGTLRAMRVLVVDDSMTTRTLERSILSAAGLEVLLAVDGLDALRVLREERVDLVVSDIDMPRLDGLALTRRIKEDRRLQQVPVLLISGVERQGLREAALEAHADAFLPKKGLEQEHLLSVIKELLK